MHPNLAPPLIAQQSWALPSPADWLQFGALGLLALVLFGAYLLARLHLEGVRRIDERLDKLIEVLLATSTDEERRRYLSNVSRRPAADAAYEAEQQALIEWARAHLNPAPATSPAPSDPPPSTGP